MLRKYFWIFIKIEKVLEKILACNGVLKIQTCSGKNFKSQEKKIWQKIKYEINTDLPSARARRFESNERDLSPAVITIVRLVLDNWTRMSLRPYATFSLHVFSWIVWSLVLMVGILVHPRVSALRHPVSSGCAALPFV